MKKLILAVSMLFMLSSGAFAYNNSLAVHCYSSDSQIGNYPTSDTKYVNINANAGIMFAVQFTHGAYLGGVGGNSWESPSYAYAYLKHGGTIVDSFTFQRNPYDNFSQQYSSTFTGYWYTMEIGMSCSYNAIGLAELRW